MFGTNRRIRYWIAATVCACLIAVFAVVLVMQPSAAEIRQMTRSRSAAETGCRTLYEGRVHGDVCYPNDGESYLLPPRPPEYGDGGETDDN
jgi:hypothetical protein